MKYSGTEFETFENLITNLAYIVRNKLITMKKRFFGLLGAFGLLMMSNASIAQVEQGNIIIDPYYGYPNLGKALAEGLIDPDATDVRATGIGPLGLRAEYMLADNFGIGIDFIYNSAGAEGTYTSTDSTGATQTYTDDVLMQRIRVLLRLNYHFVQTDALDAYVGGGAGYNQRIWSYKSTDPNYEEPDNATGALLPVAFRAALGARYYFHPNIGINAEIGLGGPILSGGISLKF